MDHSNESLVTQFKESGLTQETFCKNNGIPLESVYDIIFIKKVE
jgi:predicted transcriptional regulator